MSQITTHVLDTSKGKPAVGIAVSLYMQVLDGWNGIGKGNTNSDGRIGDLLSNDFLLTSGIYMLRFETAAYFMAMGTNAFYPAVEIIFEVTFVEHYHVPLLLNPFGYSTYRGT